MKRGQPPPRRKPLTRGRGPRSNPFTTRAWRDRTRARLPHQSPKGAVVTAEAAAVGAEVIAAEPWCHARDLVPEVDCWGGLDPQHIGPRSTHPGQRTDPSNITPVCRGHHHWIDDHPAKAEARGLHRRATT